VCITVVKACVYCSNQGLLSFHTSQYKLNFYETPTGLKFVLNTDLSVGNIRDVLQQIYSQVLLLLPLLSDVKIVCF